MEAAYICGSWKVGGEPGGRGVGSQLGSHHKVEIKNNHKRQNLEGKVFKGGNEEFWSDFLLRR